MTPIRSIVLVYYREPKFLASVLEALHQEFSDRNETEIIVVDNASGDGVVDSLRSRWADVRWITSEKNLMYGQGNNLGVQQAQGRWVLMMNCDVAWDMGQLTRFVEAVETRSDVQLAAPVIQYPDHRLQISAHTSFPTLWSIFVDYCLPLQLLLMRFGRHPMQYAAAGHQTGFVTHVTGVCLYVQREIFLQSGGFDPAYAMYLEETDWQYRLAQQNVRPYLVAESRLTHFGSAQKKWAQATTVYLASLRTYTRRWWNMASQLLAWPALWLATIISFLFLLVTLPISFIRTSIHQRVQHYLSQYMLLARHLLRV